LGWLYYRKDRIDTWKLADIVAPFVCVSLAIGRIGCFLNGCCYGHVCTEDNRCAAFPTLTSPARELVVETGLQTTAGFAMDNRVGDIIQGGRLGALVGFVEPGSPAERAGLQAGDRIIQANGQTIESYHHLQLTIVRNEEEKQLPPFVPRTLPLHPTQLYESVSMILLFFLLVAFFPYRRYYGQVFVVLMVGYAFHRFFNETLRNDTATVLWRLTLSQVGSILVLIAAVALHFFLRWYSRPATDVPVRDEQSPIPVAAGP
jgi:prolipoprotein diacylglyceryltransferase